LDRIPAGASPVSHLSSPGKPASCLVRAGIADLDAFAAMASEIHYIAAQLGQASRAGVDAGRDGPAPGGGALVRSGRPACPRSGVDLRAHTEVQADRFEDHEGRTRCVDVGGGQERRFVDDYGLPFEETVGQAP